MFYFWSLLLTNRLLQLNSNSLYTRSHNDQCSVLYRFHFKMQNFSSPQPTPCLISNWSTITIANWLTDWVRYLSRWTILLYCCFFPPTYFPSITRPPNIYRNNKLVIFNKSWLEIACYVSQIPIQTTFYTKITHSIAMGASIISLYSLNCIWALRL